MFQTINDTLLKDISNHKTCGTPLARLEFRHPTEASPYFLNYLFWCVKCKKVVKVNVSQMDLE